MTVYCICSRLRGGFEDLRRFSDISAMLRIGSKGMPISEIVTTRPKLEPLTTCSASQKLNHYTTTTPPRVSVKRCTMWIPYKRNVLNQSYGKVIIYFDRGNDNCIHLLISHKISAKNLSGIIYILHTTVSVINTATENPAMGTWSMAAVFLGVPVGSCFLIALVVLLILVCRKRKRVKQM